MSFFRTQTERAPTQRPWGDVAQPPHQPHKRNKQRKQRTHNTQPAFGRPTMAERAPEISPREMQEAQNTISGSDPPDDVSEESEEEEQECRVCRGPAEEE